MVTNTPQGGMDMNNGDFKIFNNVLMKYLGKSGVVVIPDGIQEVSHFSFQSEECAKITEIVIPASVKEVNTPFSHCSALERITVDAENQHYQAIDGNLYTKDGSILVAYAPASKRDRFAIPQGVTIVEAFAFSNSSLEYNPSFFWLKIVTPPAPDVVGTIEILVTSSLVK